MKKEMQQLQSQPEGELRKSLLEHRDRLWNLKADLAAGKVKNVKEIKKVKRAIARILTILNKPRNTKLY